MPGFSRAVTTWLATLWRIALLRAGPQDLPPGPASPLLALLLWSGIVTISGRADDRAAGLADAVVAIGLPVCLVAALLAANRRLPRFNQTTAALFGTGSIISLVNVPLWLTSVEPIPASIALLALIGLFWSLAVDGHIWRHALDTSYGGGLTIAVVILIVQMISFQALGSP